MDKEELDLLESVFTLAIGECAYNDINNIQKLEYKIKTINNLCKKQKEVIDKAKSLNHEISHIIYEDFLGENIIGSKFIYERIKKQLSILDDKEVSE